MAQSGSQSRFHLGFLWVTSTDVGYVGGLLVTNHMGRPLEFQCTTPVRPNRTQEILYGPTLRPFIYTELIGKTLFERVNIKPDLLITSQPDLLELRAQIPIPVACLIDEQQSPKELPDQTRIRLGLQQVRFHPDFSDDAEIAADRSQKISKDADLSEPLERVKDALLEAVKSNAVA